MASILPERIELILPYSKHRQEQAENFQQYSLEDNPLLEEPALIYESKKTKKGQPGGPLYYTQEGPICHENCLCSPGYSKSNGQ